MQLQTPMDISDKIIIKNQKNAVIQNYVYILSAIVLIFIAGMREVGIDKDSINYLYSFEHFTNLFESDFFEKEPFFWIILELNKHLLNTINGVFLIYAFLHISIFFYAIKKLTPLPILSIIIYIGLFYILYGMTQIRISVAISIFVISISDLLKRNIIGYFIKITIAVLFHYSAVVFYFLYFIKPKSINRIFYLILPLIGFLLAFFQPSILKLFSIFIQFLPPFLEYNLTISLGLIETDSHKVNLFNTFAMIKLIIYFVSVINIRKMKFSRDILIIKIFGWSIFLYYFLSFMPVLASRISEMLSIVLIILLVDIVFIFKQKTIPIILIIMFSTMMFSYSYYTLILNKM